MPQKVYLTTQVRVTWDRDEVRVAKLDESQLEVPGVDPDRSVDPSRGPDSPRPELQPVHPFVPTTARDQLEAVTELERVRQECVGVRPVECERVRILRSPEASFHQRITADASHRAIEETLGDRTLVLQNPKRLRFQRAVVEGEPT